MALRNEWKFEFEASKLIAPTEHRLLDTENAVWAAEARAAEIEKKLGKLRVVAGTYGEAKKVQFVNSVKPVPAEAQDEILKLAVAKDAALQDQPSLRAFLYAFTSHPEQKLSLQADDIEFFGLPTHKEK